MDVSIREAVSVPDDSRVAVESAFSVGFLCSLQAAAASPSANARKPALNVLFLIDFFLRVSYHLYCV